MIERSVQRLFSQNVDKGLRDEVEHGTFSDALWRMCSESGFDRALATEESGGIGERWSAAYPILRGLGYWQVPLPLAETMIGTLLLSLAGIELPDGPVTVIEQATDGDLVTSGAGASLRIDGSVRRVPWARHCRWAVISLANGHVGLIDLAERARVAITESANHAKLPSDGIAFDAVSCVASAPGPLPALVQPVRLLGAAARSMMMVGALEWLLEESVRYAGDRIQFGKPIGKNQALQQQLAVLAGDVAAARVAAQVAAEDAPSANQPETAAAPFSIAVAKIRCGEAATRGAAIAHQVHGAIGFTREHALHFATRRLWAWREEFGSEAWWAERLGRAVISGGSAGFWPSITARRFGERPARD